MGIRFNRHLCHNVAFSNGKICTHFLVTVDTKADLNIALTSLIVAKPKY
jgi:hypothetical protein